MSKKLDLNKVSGGQSSTFVSKGADGKDIYTGVISFTVDANGKILSSDAQDIEKYTPGAEKTGLDKPRAYFDPAQGRLIVRSYVGE